MRGYSGGGLALGISFSGVARDAAAQGADASGAPEINAWVVVRPDDTTVVRVVRSEMGQGTHTGLAQLVAEELECDWSKVTLEAPTAGTGATCRSCAHCPWMAMNTLELLNQVFEVGNNEITVDPETARKAMIPLERMLRFGEELKRQGKL